MAGLCDAGALSLNQVEGEGFVDMVWGTWECGTQAKRDVEIAVFDTGSVLVTFLKEPRSVKPFVYEWPMFDGTWTDNSIDGKADDGTVLRAERVTR